jgi:cell division protein FtsX
METFDSFHKVELLESKVRWVHTLTIVLQIIGSFIFILMMLLFIFVVSFFLMLCMKPEMFSDNMQDMLQSSLKTKKD